MPILVLRWKSATKKGCKEDVAENIRKWKDLFMLRRTKSLLAHTLPPKVVGTQQVSPFITELSIYLNYEAQFLTTLNGKILSSIVSFPFQAIVYLINASIAILQNLHV
jgi:hypothetical protein